jgi:hypothetical protein
MHKYFWSNELDWGIAMDDEYKDFAELDLSIVDFKKPEWSWGFGFDQNHGVIRHCTDDGYVTVYKIPQCIADIIIEAREYKVEHLKDLLRKIEANKRALLE